VRTWTVNAQFSGLVGITTAAHIHCCTAVAFTGTAGVATQTPSFQGFPLGVTSGNFSGIFDIDLASSYNPAFINANGGTVGALDALITGLNSGKAYLNIHTGSFPSGEIRSFLVNAPPKLIGVVSRKTHGAAGTFDLAIDKDQPNNGAVTTEPRAIGDGHSLVFEFDSLITNLATISVVDSHGVNIYLFTAILNGNTVTVNHLSVPDNSRVTVSMTLSNGSVANVSVTMGFLVGDVNFSRDVGPADISSLKARSGQLTNPANYFFDLNATGAINAADIAAAKARLGTILP
jgi:hypothetical protein